MQAAVTLLGLDWTRPWALAGLLLVSAVWWLARRGRGGQRVWSSTAELWLSSEGPSLSERSTRRLVWPLRLLLSAALCACLALAGPSASSARAPRTWRLVVDRRPAMHLAFDPGETGTRLAQALEEARGILDELRAPGDRVLFVSPSATGLEHVPEEMPESWSSAPSPALPAPEWRAFDQPGTILVSDRWTGPEPAFAGLALSGGAAMPGPVARTREGELRFDGAGLELVPASGRAPRAGTSAELPVPVPVLRALEAWADARGVEISDEGPWELELTQAAGEALGGPGDAFGEGWSWGLERVQGVPRGDVWLRDGEGRALVAWRSGRLELVSGWSAEPRGDPAAFAVAWAGLFDRVLAHPAGLASVADRRSAGAARRKLPALPERSSEGGQPSSWAAGLALLAGLLSLGALVVAGASSRRSQAGLGSAASPSSTSP